MRKAVRVTVAVLLAYLLQAIVLPHLKINGVILDITTITLFSIGYSLGPYAGLTAGMLSGLIMEVVSGDLPGLTAAVCVAAGGFGTVFAKKIHNINRPGQRRVEHNLKRFLPIVLIALFELVKESIYIGYFYLIGTEIVLRHFGRVLWASLEVGLAALVLMPVIIRFLRRRPEDTLLAKWRSKRQLHEQMAEQTGDASGTPPKGGMDA